MHRLTWQPSASEDLAEFSLAHRDRWVDIDAATNDIDYKLRRNPLHFSEAVSEGLRRIVSKPVVAYFYIDNKEVHVVAAGWAEGT